MADKFVWCCVLYLVVGLGSFIQAGNRTFEIDYIGNKFLKDGKPFRYISGSFHYHRIPSIYWRDRLDKAYAAGLNAIQILIPWNYHQPTKDTYDFTGEKDFVHFIKTAQEVGLVVLLRAGPYICAEWEFGGIPAWILQENPHTIVRTMDATYIKYVDIWLDKLLPMIKPLLYENGGPVIMTQIENEYGSYFACDTNYTEHLRDKFRVALGSNAILYTTDGSADSLLKCGTVKDAYATVDFGVSLNPAVSFKPLRDYEPMGPLVNSEFYSGWLDHWGYPHAHVDTNVFAKGLDTLLAYNEYVNVNMYMFEGGTNFGFWNGANDKPYQPCPTSYDYDAPLTEAGDITDKYIAIRQVISKYKKLPDVPIPPNTPKKAYGKVPMNFMATIQDVLEVLCPNGPIKSEYPMTMEALGQYHGFVLYRHVLRGDTPSEPHTLDLSGIRDMAYLMLDQVPQGAFYRNGVVMTNVTLKVNQTIDILVENMGHIGFASGMNNNSKGLIKNVTFGGSLLTGWLQYPLTIENFKPESMIGSFRKGPIVNGNLSTPSFYVGKLNIPQGPDDTYLDMSTWRKGQHLIQSSSMFNVGRYWPYTGPQVRLYVPKSFLAKSPTTNYVIMLELERAPCDSADKCTVQYVDQPLVNATSHRPFFTQEEHFFNRSRPSL